MKLRILLLLLFFLLSTPFLAAVIVGKTVEYLSGGCKVDLLPGTGASWCR